MTRRGSLAYYLAAIVVGCLCWAVAILVIARTTTYHWNTAREFFFLYFLVVSQGWLATLLFAFLLRKIAAAFAWSRAWQWMVAGGCIAIFVVAAWVFVPTDWIGARFIMGLLMWLLPFGNMVFVFGFARSTIVLLPTIFLVGAATAFVLHRIHRAFEPRAKSPASTEKPHT